MLSSLSQSATPSILKSSRGAVPKPRRRKARRPSLSQASRRQRRPRIRRNLHQHILRLSARRTLPAPPAEAVPPTSQQSAPIAGSLNTIQPESLRDTLDPDIRLRGSFEANKVASSKDMPSSEPPKLASTYFPPVAARPLPVQPIEAVLPTTQQSAPPSRVARGTTDSLSQSTPSTVSKTTALHPDTQQPHIGDIARRKRDQKPSKALETGSCTANIFPGYVQASARVKTGQLDVRKICADQHASFIVSLRCLVASAVCPNLSH